MTSGSLPPDGAEFDIVIVGAGSAGCVLANRLSANPSLKVLLLEAGGRDSWIWIHVPVGYLYTMGNPRTDWCLRTEAEPGLNGRSLNYPRGRVLGGSSSINGMIYMRGQARDYDLWRQMGNPGWSWDEVLPYFLRSEDQVRGADPFHSVGGEWRVEEMRLKWEILDAFRDACIECGIPATADFNRGDNEGVGYFQVNQRKGVRVSTAKAFLRPVMGRSNLTVATGAEARKLLIEHGRAVGIEYAVSGSVRQARARARVVLASGAIGSPQLLQLSGIGPGDILAEHGIPVLIDRPAVGGNLQDHLQIRLAFKISGTRTLNEQSHSLLARARMGVEYALFRSGPLSMAPSQLGCFTRSDPGQETPNLEYHVQPLTTDRLGGSLHPFPGFTASVTNLRPDSRGTVQIVSPDPSVRPSIRPCYLSAPADRRVAVDAVRLTRRVAAARALTRFAPEEFRPGPDKIDDDAILEGVGDIASTIFHPVGTCRMGPDEDAVVTPRLSVRGLDALSVVDASVMPRITSGNTNAPVVMIAEKASDMILEDLRR